MLTFKLYMFPPHVGFWMMRNHKRYTISDSCISYNTILIFTVSSTASAVIFGFLATYKTKFYCNSWEPTVILSYCYCFEYSVSSVTSCVKMPCIRDTGMTVHVRYRCDKWLCKKINEKFPMLIS